ncbi:RlpA-like double-psi beta-barrel-protein domain-containing protein-containing protein [Xylaria sp. CBS 124048]|nr:RlpA-like double-psi beta-barrel-protein domain-containing protein-containing protein [Xylaria sp. CBS 124048]
MPSKATILAAIAVLAGPVAAKTGDMTFYAPVSLSAVILACIFILVLALAVSKSTANDAVVALNPTDYANGAHCGRSIVITAKGKQKTAKVIDLCPSCGPSGIDVSPAVFDVFASPDVGRLQVTWDFV